MDKKFIIIASAAAALFTTSTYALDLNADAQKPASSFNMAHSGNSCKGHHNCGGKHKHHKHHGHHHKHHHHNQHHKHHNHHDNHGNHDHHDNH